MSLVAYRQNETGYIRVMYHCDAFAYPLLLRKSNSRFPFHCCWHTCNCKKRKRIQCCYRNATMCLFYTVNELQIFLYCYQQQKVFASSCKIPDILSQFNCFFTSTTQGPISKLQENSPNGIGVMWHLVVKVKQSRYRPGVAQRVPGS